jgi:hypothetical protein
MTTNKTLLDDMLKKTSLTIDNTKSSADNEIEFDISSNTSGVYYATYLYPDYLTIEEFIKILKWAEDKGFDTVDIKNFIAILLEYEEDKKIKENISIYGNYGSATTSMFNGAITTGTTIT